MNCWHPKQNTSKMFRTRSCCCPDRTHDNSVVQGFTRLVHNMEGTRYQVSRVLFSPDIVQAVFLQHYSVEGAMSDRGREKGESAGTGIRQGSGDSCFAIHSLTRLGTTSPASSPDRGPQTSMASTTAQSCSTSPTARGSGKVGCVSRKSVTVPRVRPQVGQASYRVR